MSVRVVVLLADEQAAGWSRKALQQASKQQADLEISLFVSDQAAASAPLCDQLERLLQLQPLDYGALLHLLILGTEQTNPPSTDELMAQVSQLPWKLVTPVQLEQPIELDDLLPVLQDRSCWFGRFSLSLSLPLPQHSRPAASEVDGYGDYDPELHEQVCHYLAPLNPANTMAVRACWELKSGFRLPPPLVLLTLTLTTTSTSQAEEEREGEKEREVDCKLLVQLGEERYGVLVRPAGGSSPPLLLLHLLHPVYAFWLRSGLEPHRVHRPAAVPTPPAHAKPPLRRTISSQSSPSCMDESISLAGWHGSSSQPPPLSSAKDDWRTQNKNSLKKLLLLSLRHVGIDKQHPEFTDLWKHLYCGCLFALRTQLHEAALDQATMLAVIRTNMNFLNVKK